MSPIRESARARGILLALLSAAGFSTLGLFAKLIFSEGFSVQQALAWRFTVASLVLWLIIGVASRTGARRPPVGKKLIPVLLLGLLGFAPQAGMYFLTVSILDPGIAGLLLYLYPSFVILLSLAVFRKRPNRIQGLSLALSLAGCALTFFRPGSYPIVGLVLGAVMALFYGSYLVVSERLLEGVDPIRATALIMLVAAASYWVLTFATGTAKLPGTGASVLGILCVGSIATVLPITTLFAAMKRIGASDTSLVSTLEPVLTIALSAIIIGERLGTAQAIGGCLILAAVVVLRFEPVPVRPAKLS
ncbi:MAG TPA: DMT family transporter [Rectinemataceae bacterium]|nr:DMT family transporter [Rectinemataceae bacterium]